MDPFTKDELKAAQSAVEQTALHLLETETQFGQILSDLCNTALEAAYEERLKLGTPTNSPWVDAERSAAQQAATAQADRWVERLIPFLFRGKVEDQLKVHPEIVRQLCDSALNAAIAKRLKP